MKFSPISTDGASQPLSLERLVAAVRWAATETLLEWTRRAARLAQQHHDFDGPDPDDGDFDIAVLELMQ